MMRHDPDDDWLEAMCRYTDAEVAAFDASAMEAALATAEAMTPDELTDAFHATQEAP